MTKKNGDKWRSADEIKSGQKIGEESEGKWYYGDTEVSKGELKAGDFAILEEGTGTSKTYKVYQYHEDINQWTARVPFILANQDERLISGITDGTGISEITDYYLCGFRVDRLIGGEIAESTTNEQTTETKPYMNIGGRWSERTDDILEPLLRITKQDGSDWNSIEELNADGVKYYSQGQLVSPMGNEFAVVKGKWYANGVETTPIQGDCAYVNSKDDEGKNVVQQWEYDHSSWRMIDQYEQL